MGEWLTQSGYDVRFEWGEDGVRTLAPLCRAVILVDVLSFSTATCVAVSRGAAVYPYRYKDDSAREFARSQNAILAGGRSQPGYSLSPQSLQELPPGTRIVLPSPNGATLTLATGKTPTFAGCLLNAKAVAQAAMPCGFPIAVIACGERWPESGALRPALEDLLGAGAILHHLTGTKSPEVQAAEAAFRQHRDNLPSSLQDSISGQELAVRGFGEDVAIAANLNRQDAAPRLRDGAYQPN